MDEGEFLRGFGERVRGERVRRGLSRRRLAEEAAISERYITQVESGKGNVSLLVLRQIAGALGVSLSALIDATNVDRSARIALIGLRGAGKSTLGSALASKLNVPFFELDREIERLSGSSLGEVIELYGQEAYRRYELLALERLLESHPTFVVATGGGIVTEPVTYERLRHHCFTVWVRATPEEHMARVKAQGDHRPMAGSDRAMDDLRRILGERTPLYQRADAVLSTSRATEKQSVRELLGLVSEL